MKSSRAFIAKEDPLVKMFFSGNNYTIVLYNVTTINTENTLSNLYGIDIYLLDGINSSNWKPVFYQLYSDSNAAILIVLPTSGEIVSGDI